MASFMDYYRDELAKRGAGAAKSPSRSLPVAAKGPQEDEGILSTKSPVGWVLDMISRPLYGATNMINKTFDDVQQFTKTHPERGIAAALSPDTLGAMAESISKSGGRFVEGMTSNNDANKKSTSDLIEKGTDTYAPILDKNYVDVQDNVNPVAKGVLGFAGDIALDPLTYIPGGLFLQAGKNVVRGADKVLGAVSKGLVGAKDAGKAAEVVEKAAKAPKKAKSSRFGGEENPFEGINDLQPDDFRPTQPVQALDIPKTFNMEAIGTDLSRVQEILGRAPERQAIESAQTAVPAAAREVPEVVSEAGSAATGRSASPEPRVTAEQTAPDLSSVIDEAGAIPTAGRSVADLIMQSPNRAPIAQVLTDVADTMTSPKALPNYNQWANSLPPTHIVKDPTGSVQPFTVSKLRDDLARYQDKSIKPALKPSKEYIERSLNLLRQQYQREIAPQANVVDALSAFRAKAASEARSMRSAVGDELFDFLSSVNSPSTFHKTLSQIRHVIEPDEGVMDALRNMDQRLSRILTDRLGVPRAAKPKTPEEAAQFAERLLSANEPYQAAMAKGLAKALNEELTDLAEKGYAYFIRKNGLDIARTSSAAGAGKGRYVDQLNGFSQYTMLRSQADAIEIAALDIMRARGIKGMSFTGLYSAQRTAIYKEAVLRVLDDQARLLDDIGAHMSIGVGADTVQLSMAEVYRGLLSTADSMGIGKTIDQGLFNYGTQAAPTAVTDAVAAAVAGASRADVLAMLLSPKKYGNKGLLPNAQGKRPNNLLDSGHGWGFAPNARAAAQRLANEVGAKVMPNPSGKGWFVQYRFEGKNPMAEALADTIMRAKDDLASRAAENEIAFVSRTRQEAHKLSTDELAKIEAFLKDPSGAIAKIRAFKARNQRIEADAATINASPDAVQAAQGIVEASLGERLVTTMAAAGRAEPKYVSAETAIDLRQANETFTGGTWDSVVDDFSARPSVDELEDPLTGLRPNEEWAEVVDETTPLHGDWRDMLFDEAADFIAPAGAKPKPKKTKKSGKFVDLSQDAPAMIDQFGDRVIDPYGMMKHKIRQWFDQNYRMGNVMPIAHAWQNSMSMRSAYIGHQLNAIHKAAKKLSPDQDLLPAAFSQLQAGVRATEPRMAQVQDMIQGVLGDFFDLDAAGSMGNVFLRTTSKPELINAMLKQKGLDQAFDLDLAKRTAAEQGVPLDAALADQWRGWKIDDPLDFMHRLSQARQELAFNKGAAMSFVQMAKEAGAFSSKKAPGFVRVTATGESRFAAHLPENTFVKKDLAVELQRVEEVLRTSREFKGQVGDFVRNTYAPLLNAWKFAITLPRPGHHIRNLIGDTSITWMRRGNRYFARSWKDAAKLLATRPSYTDVNMLEAATRYGTRDLPRGGDVIIGSEKYGDFTADELYAALAEGGALPTYNIGEDFVDASGRLNEILGKVTLRDTRVGEGLGKLSEGRDHLSRFQHFIQIIRQDQRGWKGSRESLIDHAVQEVIKYHPDASLLTTVESKIRLAIPFYSWFGKILPAIVESTVMHPGRLSAFNKASYNWAVASGLDPTSLSDPFPDDQLFPSFITEGGLGPQFTAEALPLPGADQQYIRMNPGIAHLDVMNSIGPDPIRGLAGMVSPLIRVPAELLSGGSWSTGAKINDWSDYVDQSIPGVNYVANVSGISPTGSVESLLSGNGVDEQRGIQKGTKTDFDKALSVANWITGLGIQNLSRENYVNYAEIERRNEARDK